MSGAGGCQQKQIAAVIILIGAGFDAIWYLDGLSKEQQVPQQTSQRDSRRRLLSAQGRKVKPKLRRRAS